MGPLDGRCEDAAFVFGLAELKDGEVCAVECFGWTCQEQGSGCNRNHCGFFPQAVPAGLGSCKFGRVWPESSPHHAPLNHGSAVSIAPTLTHFLMQIFSSVVQ